MAIVTPVVVACAALAAAGAALVAGALTDTASPERRGVPGPDVRAWGRRAAAGAAGGLAAGAAVWWATGWPVAGGWAALAGAVAPTMAGRGRGRRADQARTEAVARWARMLADQVRVGADLATAVRVSARLAPAPLAPALGRLARRLPIEGPAPALGALADELADPMADLVAAALVMAMTRPTGRVADLLGELARSCEEQAAMRGRVETDRRRVRTVVRGSALAIFGWLVAIFVLSGHYFDPYTSASGQAMLVVVGAAFAAGVWGLARMDTLAAPPRLLLARPDLVAGDPARPGVRR